MINVTIDIDGARDPLYVLELGEALAESVRALNQVRLEQRGESSEEGGDG